MSKIWSIIKNDGRHLFNNVISLVVCFGMIVVPSFYAWFNIAGAWDPYGNTSNLKIALVNSDDGYKSELMPVEVNMGERIVSQLRASKSIGYVVTDQDDALDGVASGQYYAAIVIPSDFTHNMLTGLTQGDTSTQPTVEYYSNQKRNAIADIVTDKASTAVQQTIDQSFVETAVEVGAGTLDELDNYLDDDKLTSVVKSLDNSLGTTSDNLRSTATNVEQYAALVGSVRKLAADADNTLSSSLSGTYDAGDTLRESATGVRQFDTALDGATSSLDNALAKGTSSLDDVRDSIDSAFDTADGQTDELVSKLGDAKTAVDRQRTVLQKLLDDLDGTDTLVKNLPGYTGNIGNASVSYADQLSITVKGMNARVTDAKTRMDNLSDGLQETMDDLSNAKTDAATAKSQLYDLVDQARSSMSNVNAEYASGLGASLNNLANGIDNAASTVDSVSGQLDGTVQDLQNATKSTDQSLADLQDTLTNAAGKLRDTATDLDNLRAKVHAALESGDIEQLRQILSADAESLADFISDPIQLDRNAVYPVANNGSAMAPFYTTLSIWIGGVILCALVKTAPSRKALEAIGARPRHAYFGRITFFVIIGFLQTLLVVGGDLFYLGIQCVHPWLFTLACLVSSLVFVNLIFALTASFGDVGKAIAVVLMVIQVAGSGGTFPKEMLPPAFQAMYPFLPFVQAETCMRSAIAGLYGADFWIALVKLLAFLVPSLILGLLLRKPVIRLNHWVERKLENTKLM